MKRSSTHTLNSIRRNAVLGAALAAVSVATGCRQEAAQPVLAKIGGYEVTESHFRNAFLQYYYQTGQAVPINDVTKKAVLDGELDRFAIVTWAADKGWHDDEEGTRNREMLRRKVWMEDYERLVVHRGVAVDEADMRELFRRFNTRVRASHLYAPDRATADSLYARLQAGENFEDLSRQVFSNAHLRDNGGDLGFFTVDEMDPAFENMAFRLQRDEISPVVRTDLGYSIIKVTDVAQKPIVTEAEFAQRRQALHDYALQRNREMATRRDLQRKTERIRIAEPVFAELLRSMPPNAEGRRFAGALPDTATVATLDGFRLSVAEFRHEAALTPDFDYAGANALRELVDGIVFRAQSIAQLKAEPSFDADRAEKTAEATFHAWLVERFNAFLDQEVRVPEAQLRAMYDGNAEFRKSPLLLNLSELVASSEADAKAALAEMKAGLPFKEAMVKYGVNGEALLYDGELGLRPVDSFGKFATALKDLAPRAYSAPLEYLPDRWLVYLCHERVEPGEMGFEEARPGLEAIRKNEEVQKLRQSILDETKRLHKAEADYDKMKTVSITI